MVDYVKLGIYAGSVLIGGGVIAFIVQWVQSRRERRKQKQQQFPQINPYFPQQEQLRGNPQMGWEPVLNNQQTPSFPVEPQQQRVVHPQENQDIVLMKQEFEHFKEHLEKISIAINSLQVKKEEPKKEELPKIELPKIEIKEEEEPKKINEKEVKGSMTLSVTLPDNLDERSHDIMRQKIDSIVKKNLQNLKKDVRKDKLEADIDYEVV